MNLNYGIFQPLRMYEKRSHQNRFRPGGEANVFNLLCPTTHVLPFQIRRPASNLGVQYIRLVPLSGGGNIDLLSTIPAADLKVYNFPTYDVIAYFGQAAHGQAVPPGRYEVEIGDGSNSWVSEVLTLKSFSPSIDADGCALTKITYWDTCSVDTIFYGTVAQGDQQYKNILYLDLDIGKPKYKYFEKGEEDAEGVFSPELQTLGKQYFIQGVFPEYMTDALSVIPLHVNNDANKGAVEVLTYRGYTGRVDRFAVDPDWQGAIGAYAKTDILFSTHLMVKAGCCGAGSGSGSGSDSIADTCVRDYVHVVARITEDSAEYTGGYYVSRATGQNVQFENLDQIVVDLLNGDQALKVASATPGLYNNSTVAPGVVLLNFNEFNGGGDVASIYAFKSYDRPLFIVRPEIVSNVFVSGTTLRIKGMTYADSRVEIMGLPGDVILATGTGDQYNTTGIEYDAGGFQRVYVECFGINCTLGRSGSLRLPENPGEWTTPPIGEGETDFTGVEEEGMGEGNTNAGVGFAIVGSTNIVG